MDKTELLSILKSERDNSLGVNDGTLSLERAKALDHYHGRLYGNEQEGRSQVISKDLSEAVDAVMPLIMEVFLKSGTLVEFPPMGPDDEDAAEQSTDYINWLIMQKNEGFMVLHDVCKDALILKNGYAKHYWEEEKYSREEEYHDLTIEDITKLEFDLSKNGDTVELLGQEEKIVDTPLGPVPMFDIKIKISGKKGDICIEAVPTEEVRVSKNCRGALRNASFVEHVTTKTRSELVEMGMSIDFVDTLSATQSVADNISVRNARDSVQEEAGSVWSTGNHSMDRVEYCEAYIRVDWDNDGIAELRKVVTVNNQIPDGDDWNEPIDVMPMTSFVGKRVPHRHVGESLDDELAELQLINTTLVRQMLDNIFHTNHNQWLANDLVNFQDLMDSGPGAIYRVDGTNPVSGSLEPVMVPNILGQILPAIDWVDRRKASYTGINEGVTGVDPDFLQQTTKGAYLENASRSAKKVEMYIRMLGECVKEMAHAVYAIVTKYQDKPQIIKLRGKFVEIDPRSWPERYNSKVNIGLGSGTGEDKRNRLVALSQIQEGLKPYGLVGPEQVYRAAVDIAKTLGFDMPEKYAIAPGSPEHQQLLQQQQQQQQAAEQAQNGILAQAEQVKGQFAIEKEKMSLQMKAMADDYANKLKELQMRYDAQEKEKQRMFDGMQAHLDRVSKEAIEAAKIELQGMVEGMRLDVGPKGVGTMPESEGINV